MNPLRVFCLVACLAAAAVAMPKSHSGNPSLKPSQWLPAQDLEAIPSVEELTLDRLANMPLEEGARMVERLYHLSQINHDLTPNFVPSASNIPVTIVKPNGPNVKTTLNQFVQTVKQEPNFGEDEVTIFITGLPQTTPAVTKAYRKLIDAYKLRYNSQKPQPQKPKDYDYEYSNKAPSSSEEDIEYWKTPKGTTGNLVIIDLGSALPNFKRYALLDIEQTGAMVGKELVTLTNEADVPHEIIKIVAQGVGAHVAGAAGRTYTRYTGHQLRRITALDPAKIFARKPNTITGLARGDAQFVDAIHTSTYGMGTPQRVGDVDFYPNGPSAGVAGSDNVVEASMRATRYFAESVRPGNERNFPAVPAVSVMQYKNNNGYGKRDYMGIAASYDLKGDYMLTVNTKSPFGMYSPARKQNNYHGIHTSWKNTNNQDYE